MQTLIPVSVIIIYLSLDALHDKAVIKWGVSKDNERKKQSRYWHFYDAVIKGFIAGVIFYLLFDNIYDTIRWVIFFAAMRYGPFSVALNLIRGEDWNHRGKNILDKIGGKYWIPQIFLLIFAIILLYFGDKTNYIIDNIISWNGLIALILFIVFGFLAYKMYNKK
ncbi:MAG: hypothetical protein H8D45_30990 [Bacteroidetes bacterium]|nr:hypothetical protein [Bacteroidota bacterium]